LETENDDSHFRQWILGDFVLRQTSLPAPQRAADFKLTKEKRNDVDPHLAKLVWSTATKITMEAATIIQPPSLYQPTYFF
jgi:hypothetical protein